MAPNYRGGPQTVGMLSRARELRRQSTAAERRLWQLLRSGQLSGLKFRRQHQFGPYVLDFYCAAAQLAIEADGGQHFEPEGIAQDAARTAYLAARGVRVLRFTNVDILTQPRAVVEAIELALRSPSP